MEIHPLHSLTPHPELVHVDRPEISETFADSVWRLSFNGSNLRMEFVVARLDEPTPGLPIKGKALTSCRIVMPLSGMIDMAGKLQNLIAQLKEAGAVREVNPAPGPEHPQPN